MANKERLNKIDLLGGNKKNLVALPADCVCWLCVFLSLSVCGVRYTDQRSTLFFFCCWSVTPRLSSQILVSDLCLLANEDGNGRNNKTTRCVLLFRYGASSRHRHRLLRPSLAVASDQRSGESDLRGLCCYLCSGIFEIEVSQLYDINNEVLVFPGKVSSVCVGFISHNKTWLNPDDDYLLDILVVILLCPGL